MEKLQCPECGTVFDQPEGLGPEDCTCPACGFTYDSPKDQDETKEFLPWVLD